jgi:hypothetical protein
MKDRSVFCAGCGHFFEDGDVVYRKRREPDRWSRDRSLKGFCRGCVSKWHPSWLEQAHKPLPCAGGCGVLVSDWFEDRYLPERPPGERFVRAVTTCSSHCTEQAHNARRRKSAPTSCAGCGETFTPKRADARYCAAACKQRAYRKRGAS